eukprot:TRINITY_DN15971_c0_g1_i2.p1 TRINITY_DN15971_c0_g1~~TRINITY_DN15971_c0_g1_i2.p1  ORF type:complete len:425 (+),score=59.27 TRINITY_DN15971_c0_g1_i2:36-1310(+)
MVLCTVLIHGVEMHAVTLVLMLGLALGEESNATCAEDGAALLQRRIDRAPCSTTTTSTAGFVIYPDALNPLPVPKVLVDGSPLRMYYRVPLDMPDNQVLRVNSTHVTIPSNASVQATYIRNITVSQSPGWHADYGVVNQIWGFNEVSLFPYANFGAAEKLISFGREGVSINLQEMQRADKQHGQSVPPASVTFQRNLLVNMFKASGGSSKQNVQSGIDPVQLQMLAGEIATGDGTIGPELVHTAEYLKSVEGSFKNAAESYPSSNNCHHFGNGLLTAEGLVMPLGKPWLSYKGLITFDKGVDFWSSTGTTVVEYDQASNSLEIYYYAAALFNLVEEYDDQTLAAVYYQGPPHTANDNRVQDWGPLPEAHVIYQQYHMIPPNYEQWWPMWLQTNSIHVLRCLYPFYENRCRRDLTGIVREAVVAE